MRGFLVVLLLCLSPLSWAAEVNGVRVWAGPEGTRVVFDLSAPVAHNLFSLKNPNRIVLEARYWAELLEWYDRMAKLDEGKRAHGS